MFGLLNKKVYQIIIACVLAITLALVTADIIIPTILVILITVIILNKEKLILGMIILIYLTASADLYSEYRLYLNIFNTLLLFFLFLYKYGLKFDNYQKVPREIILFIAVLLFSLWISTIFSLKPASSALELIRMIFFLVICYIFYSLLDKDYKVYVYIYTLIGIMVIWGLRMVVDVYNLGVETYFVRSLLGDKSELYGRVSNTGMTVFFISIALIVALFFNSKFKNPSAKFLLKILFGFNIIVLILANSRGGIAAALLSIAFILLVLNKSLFLKAIIIGSAITVFLIFIIPGLSESVDIYLRWHTLSDREPFWNSGLRVIADHSLFGLGPGLFADYFYVYASSSLINYYSNSGLDIGNPHPHNIFLYYTAENGILGLIVAIGFFYMFFYFASKTLKLTKNINRDYFILTTAITGIGLGLFFRSFIEITGFLTYGYITTDLPFWLVFGILIFIYQKFKKQNVQYESPRTKNLY